MNKVANILIDSIKTSLLYELKFYGKHNGYYSYADCMKSFNKYPDLPILYEYNRKGILIGYVIVSGVVKVAGMYFVHGEDGQLVLV
jgi:hypothetical protein